MKNLILDFAEIVMFNQNNYENVLYVLSIFQFVVGKLDSRGDVDKKP